MIFKKLYKRAIPVVFFILFFLGSNGHCQHPDTADYLVISLLTTSEGEELYSTFGHSTFRIRNSVKRSDIVYNYGTFDFSTPNFYTKFVKGDLLYFLSKMPFKYLIESTKDENRSITENILLLSREEKLDLFNKLETNYLPGNREYKYDFLLDNCSTRLLDLIDTVVGGKYKPQQVDFHKSYKQVLKPYWKYNPWSGLGIEIILGHEIDSEISAVQSTFLPENLKTYLAGYRNKVNGTPILAKDEILLERTPLKKPLKPFIPILVITIVFAFSVILKRKSALFPVLNRSFDYTIFLIYSLLGIFLMSLALVSDYKIVQWNLNLLWANPVYSVFLLPVLRNKVILRYIALTVLALTTIILIYYSYKAEIIILILLLASRIINVRSRYSSIPD